MYGERASRQAVSSSAEGVKNAVVSRPYSIHLYDAPKYLQVIAAKWLGQKEWVPVCERAPGGWVECRTAQGGGRIMHALKQIIMYVQVFKLNIKAGTCTWPLLGHARGGSSLCTFKTARSIGAYGIHNMVCQVRMQLACKYGHDFK